jgi:hypothetical protein
MGITFGQIFKEIRFYTDHIRTIRYCFICLLLLITINVAFTAAISIVITDKLNKIEQQTQEYILPLLELTQEYMED